MNMQDDYSKISQFALEEKKSKVLEKWLKDKIPTYYIMVDTDHGPGMSPASEILAAIKNQPFKYHRYDTSFSFKARIEVAPGKGCTNTIIILPAEAAGSLN